MQKNDPLESQAIPHPGDLARRVGHRRSELGMSIEELAKSGGMDPGYLRYFEKSPDARLSAGTMYLLALALDTTPLALLGGEIDRPPGHGRAGRHPGLDTLTKEQCDAHLAAGGVGRVIFPTTRGPVALPVNFEFTDGEVVFSTNDAKALVLETEDVVGFEIDRVDEAMSEGWSVLATGRARRIEDLDEVQRLESLDLEAWAGGARHTLIGIRPDELTGRVIVHHSNPDHG
jgi:transcriptional regulator with XRE-family HTH domain